MLEVVFSLLDFSIFIPLCNLIGCSQNLEQSKGFKAFAHFLVSGHKTIFGRTDQEDS